MFKVYRNNRVATKTLFDTYEAARQFVRKQLRKLTDQRSAGQPVLTLVTAGFKIKST